MTIGQNPSSSCSSSDETSLASESCLSNRWTDWSKPWAKPNSSPQLCSAWGRPPCYLTSHHQFLPSLCRTAPPLLASAVPKRLPTLLAFLCNFNLREVSPDSRATSFTAHGKTVLKRISVQVAFLLSG